MLTNLFVHKYELLELHVICYLSEVSETFWSFTRSLFLVLLYPFGKST